MRIAYVEPVVGLNVYGRELLPHLARHVEVEVVTDADRSRLCDDVAGAFPIVSYAQAAARANGHYDQMVFQLRNNPRHTSVYDLLLAQGGVSVMHEVNLLGIIGAQTLRQGRRLAFLRQMWLNEGPVTALQAGVDLFLLRRGVKRWSHLLMNRQAIRRSRGVIVHNRDAARVLKARYPHLAVQTVRRGVPPAPLFDDAALRRELGLADRWPVLASFGVVNQRKRIAQVLQAMVEVVNEFPRAVYVLVGQVFEFDLQGMVDRLGLSRHVRATGRVDDDAFAKYLAVTDIGINLRYPTEGETSSTALRIMSYGKPMLVTDAGSLAEFPDNCVVKVSPGATEVEEIRRGLLALAGDETLRRQVGQAALTYVAENHTWEQAAQTYYRFLMKIKEING